MHQLSASFVLGYHGCDSAVAKRLLNGDRFKPSDNDYDWLGFGVYFWEANPERGLEFAHEASQRVSSIKIPDVVGAILDLGSCLDLTTKASADMVKTAHESYQKTLKSSGQKPPQNSPGLLLRRLDCAVINHLCQIWEETGNDKIDSVRGVFIEGEPVYPGSGIHAKTHVQIAIRNPECIKGVFRYPPPEIFGV